MKIIAYVVLLFLIFYSIYILFKPYKNKKNKKEHNSKNIPVSQTEEPIKVYPDGRIDFPKREKNNTKEPPLKDGYKRFYTTKGFIDYKPPNPSRGNPIDDILYSTFIEEREKQKKKPKKFKVRKIECWVNGIYYRSYNAKYVARYLRVGDPVHLKREPTNKHDHFAVKVISKGEHIGYIPASLSPEVTNGIIKYGYNVYVSYKNAYEDNEDISLKIMLFPKDKKSDD
ncbi:HIRAN domain-containing protein [Dysgonomonas termitidis]|uniref:HIRAN domain-containing protein n=1 Tax=Dysgonomonas termitidis TaxID=1516126 RepID=A0ABV9KQ86_9BACT